MIDKIKEILDSMENELTHGACIVDKNRVVKQILSLFDGWVELDQELHYSVEDSFVSPEAMETVRKAGFRKVKL